MRTALTIAGSDSGGGAGIQADLKTFAAVGVYGTCAITAITAQNTVGVTAWEPVSTELVIAQIEAIAIEGLDLPNLVVDPVMIAKGGDRLLREDAVGAIKAHLLPLAEVLTPNVPEAEVLTGSPIRTIADMHDAAKRIRDLGPRVVVVKGGHLQSRELENEVIDVVCTPNGTIELRGARIHTTHTHGTGCTFASAIAAQLALGSSVEEAVRWAREYLEGAIRHAPGLGSGHGPLNHFWRVY